MWYLKLMVDRQGEYEVVHEELYKSKPAAEQVAQATYHHVKHLRLLPVNE